MKPTRGYRQLKLWIFVILYGAVTGSAFGVLMYFFPVENRLLAGLCIGIFVGLTLPWILRRKEHWFYRS